MRKTILLWICCSLAWASCDTSANNEVQVQQALIDSVARANAARQNEINRRKNDSTINAIAVAKADSIEKVNEKTKAPPVSIDPPGKPDTSRTETSPSPDSKAHQH